MKSSRKRTAARAIERPRSSFWTASKSSSSASPDTVHKHNNLRLLDLIGTALQTFNDPPSREACTPSRRIIAHS